MKFSIGGLIGSGLIGSCVVTALLSLDPSSAIAGTKVWRLKSATLQGGEVEYKCFLGEVLQNREEGKGLEFNLESGFREARCRSNLCGAHTDLRVGLYPVSGVNYQAHLALSVVTLESQVAAVSPVAALALGRMFGMSAQAEQNFVESMSNFVNRGLANGWNAKPTALTQDVPMTCRQYTRTLFGKVIPDGRMGSKRTMECSGGTYQDAKGRRPDVTIKFEQVEI